MKTLSGSLIIIILSFDLIFNSGCKKEDPDSSLTNELGKIRGYKDHFIEDFRCGVFVPPFYNPEKKYPLVISLHGYTDTTTWNLKWYNEPILSKDPCIVLTPKCLKEDPYGWGDSYDPRTSPMMANVFQMIELSKKAFNLDYERFYIYGSSMGGYGTYGVLQKNPDMFAAAYVECANGNLSMVPILAKIPFWIFHGSADPVVPVQGARDMYKAVLEAGGTQIKYTEKAGYAHNIWDYTTNEPTICSWLLAQRKGSVHGQPDPVENIQISLKDHIHPIINWNPPSNNSNPDNQIWYYKIYFNENVIDEVDNTNNSYIHNSDKNLPTDIYRISAVNYFFKESVLSSNLSLK